MTERERQDDMLEIIIGHRGWVWVGRTRQEGTTVIVERARCVRRWGTARGLAQLATEGPLPDTRLDDAATLRLHELAIVGRYECDEGAWDGAV